MSSNSDRLRQKYHSSSTDEDDNDEDDRGTAIKLRNLCEGQKVTRMGCKYRKCDREVVVVNDEDYYCSRECHQLRLEERLHAGGGGTVKVTRLMAILGRGGTGLLTGPIPPERLVVHVDESQRRFVKLEKARSNWLLTKSQRSLRDKSERRKQKAEEKSRLMSLLNCGSDDSSEEDSGDCSSEEDAHPEELDSSVRQTYVCPRHSALEIGRYIKAYVVNIASPWELYVQTGDMVLKSNEIEVICNSPDSFHPDLEIAHWAPAVGEHCCAKYEGKLYRAQILSQEGNSSYCVRYVDYGNKNSVSRQDLQQMNPEVTMIPEQCICFRLSNVRPKNADNWSVEVIRYTIDNLDGGVVNLEINDVEPPDNIHVGRLSIVSSISGSVIGDFGVNLVQHTLAEAVCSQRSSTKCTNVQRGLNE